MFVLASCQSIAPSLVSVDSTYLVGQVMVSITAQTRGADAHGNEGEVGEIALQLRADQISSHNTLSPMAFGQLMRRRAADPGIEMHTVYARRRGVKGCVFIFVVVGGGNHEARCLRRPNFRLRPNG